MEDIVFSCFTTVEEGDLFIKGQHECLLWSAELCPTDKRMCWCDEIPGLISLSAARAEVRIWRV